MLQVIICQVTPIQQCNVVADLHRVMLLLDEPREREGLCTTFDNSSSALGRFASTSISGWRGMQANVAWNMSFAAAPPEDVCYAFLKAA
jgi:hypothetical protein